MMKNILWQMYLKIQIVIDEVIIVLHSVVNSIIKASLLEVIKTSIIRFLFKSVYLKWYK